jgi:hypothetical protein
MERVERIGPAPTFGLTTPAHSQLRIASSMSCNAKFTV